MSAITTPASRGGSGPVGTALDELDQRFHPAAGLRRQFNKVFPTHWSFMLGEVALYSFVVLLISGIYLGLFFDPSMTEVVYDGPFDNLRGVHMSRAYESALEISFQVRGGLFVRQVHHWAALLFVAAMFAHMFRTFFTGAFRKPREANWIIGLVLILVGTFEGFTGYSLPDDLLSGTGLRIMSGIILSIPVIGTWSHWAVFGGEFPGTEILPRLYIIHVLLLPGVLLALIGVHVGLVWYQKHTQFPGPGRTEGNVVGVRILPAFAAKGYPAGSPLEREIPRLLLDGFCTLLDRLASEVPTRFHRVDTRGAVGTEWADEIHPNARGAKAVAERFERVLRRFALVPAVPTPAASSGLPRSTSLRAVKRAS